MRYRIALFVLAASPLIAQSRFEGTWEMKMDTLMFSGPAEKYWIQDGRYRCLSCVPPVDVPTDDADHKVPGHEDFYDTLAVRIISDDSVSFTFKKNGKLAAKSVETVSDDGTAMTEAFSNNGDAETVTGKAGFTRVSSGPPGSHALSGEWRMNTVHNSTAAGTLTRFESTPDGLKISDGIQTYAAKFDGNDYPIGRSGHATISLKLIDEYTLEETDKRDGKLISVSRMTVAKDGRSMKVESTDKQRGGIMTYTADKLP
jgi:hypothetical protein